jgi:hypothetical protein
MTHLITAEVSGWRVASLDHTTRDDKWIRWFAPRDAGYKAFLDEAGLYELDRLLDRPEYYGAWNVLCIPDYVARRLVPRRGGGCSGAVKNTAAAWAALHLTSLFQHPKPHPGPFPKKTANGGQQ